MNAIVLAHQKNRLPKRKPPSSSIAMVRYKRQVSPPARSSIDA